MINFFDPKQIFLKNKKKIVSSLVNVIESGNYILGKEVDNFEKNFQIILKPNMVLLFLMQRMQFKLH